MFGGYLASEKDFNAISRALSYVKHPKLKFIFEDYSRIKNTRIVSYDSKHIFIWKLNSAKPFKIAHKIKIQNSWQLGWKAGLEVNKIKNLLPKRIKNTSRFDVPIISGGLLTPFVKLQKKKKPHNNPYVTEKSYLATIIHEFGHIYWNSFKLWWYSDKKENLRFLNQTLKLYEGKTTHTETPKFPTPCYIGEIFAFCTEYSASDIFYPSHKKAIDKFTQVRLVKIIKKEKGSDLDEKDSVLEPSKNLHDFAMVFGKIIMTKYPKDWPTILTRPGSIY